MKKSKNNNIILGFSFWFQLMQRKDLMFLKIQVPKLCKYVSFVNFEEHLKAENICKLYYGKEDYYPLANPPVDLHWFFEISISAFISNWDKNSVIK